MHWLVNRHGNLEMLLAVSRAVAGSVCSLTCAHPPLRADRRHQLIFVRHQMPCITGVDPTASTKLADAHAG
jgi:hypothetical protein